MSTIAKFIAYVTIPVLSPVVGFLALHFLVRTGLFTTGETRTNRLGSEQPVFESALNERVAIGIFLAPMFGAFLALLWGFDALVVSQ